MCQLDCHGLGGFGRISRRARPRPAPRQPLERVGSNAPPTATACDQAQTSPPQTLGIGGWKQGQLTRGGRRAYASTSAPAPGPREPGSGDPAPRPWGQPRPRGRDPRLESSSRARHTRKPGPRIRDRGPRAPGRPQPPTRGRSRRQPDSSGQRRAPASTSGARARQPEGELLNRVRRLEVRLENRRLELCRFHRRAEGLALRVLPLVRHAEEDAILAPADLEPALATSRSSGGGCRGALR